jgi:hypothetical protein
MLKKLKEQMLLIKQILEKKLLIKLTGSIELISSEEK